MSSSNRLMKKAHNGYCSGAVSQSMRTAGRPTDPLLRVHSATDETHQPTAEAEAEAEGATCVLE